MNEMIKADPALPKLGSGQMFDQIAPRYDFVNRVLSLGLDRRWRRRVIKELALAPNARVLDVATGTGDLAIELAKAVPAGKVIGLDPFNILRSVTDLIRYIWDMGFDAIEWLWRYFLLGAVIVVPIWLIVRLMRAPKGR